MQLLALSRDAGTHGNQSMQRFSVPESFHIPHSGILPLWRGRRRIIVTTVLALPFLPLESMRFASSLRGIDRRFLGCVGNQRYVCGDDFFRRRRRQRRIIRATRKQYDAHEHREQADDSHLGSSKLSDQANLARQRCFLASYESVDIRTRAHVLTSNVIPFPNEAMAARILLCCETLNQKPTHIVDG